MNPCGVSFPVEIEFSFLQKTLSLLIKGVNHVQMTNAGIIIYLLFL